MRKLIIVLAVMATVVLSAAPALAGTVIDQAVASLRSNPVYVGPGATLNLAPADAVRLRQEIAGSRYPIYLAVLAPSAADEASGANSVPAAIGRQLGTGTVGTVAGNKFRAGASRGVLPPGRAAALATAAFDAHHTAGLYPVLSDFVHRVRLETAQQAGATGPAPQAAPVSHKDSGVPVWLIVLAVAAICATIGLGIAFYVVHRNRQREREEQERMRNLANYDSMRQMANRGARAQRKATDYEDGQVHQAKPRAGDKVGDQSVASQTYQSGSRWYPGGYYGGMFYGPGYYPGSFLEGYLWASLLMDNDRDVDVHEDRGDGGDFAGGGASGDYEPAGDYDSGSDAGTSGGGGDFGSSDDVSAPAPEPDPAPSYEPSYDSGGGSDYGGGGDSGGGFDSGGGGGFDSGGGGGGGGDF